MPPPGALLFSTVVKCSLKLSFSTYIIGRFYVLSWSLAYQVAFKLFETDKMPKGISTMEVVALVPKPQIGLKRAGLLRFGGTGAITPMVEIPLGRQYLPRYVPYTL